MLTTTPSTTYDPPYAITIYTHTHTQINTLQVFVDPQYAGGFQAGAPAAVIPQLRAHAGMQAHAAAREAIEELSLMASYLEAFGTVGSVHIDLSPQYLNHDDRQWIALQLKQLATQLEQLNDKDASA